MWMLILTIISALVFGALIFCTKVQTKTRTRLSEYWCNIPWEDAGKPKWNRLTLIVSGIICLVPVVNILGAILVFIKYCNQLNAPNWDNGRELVYKRIVFKNLVTDWLMEEV